MTREELIELGYIVPIATVPSILQHGILSHRRAQKLKHEDIAMAAVQERRSKVTIPAGRPLHDYANLYICPRNPMLYVRKDMHTAICVLRVSTDVLDLPGAIVTDANAAGGLTAFRPAPQGLQIVDRALTFARYWTHADAMEQHRRKSAKCAEVLVPDVIAPGYITGAYISGTVGRDRLAEVGDGLPATVNSDLFFV